MTIGYHTVINAVHKILARYRKNYLREYWRKRAQRYGVRAVINLSHNIENLEKITSVQKGILFPIFLRYLKSDKPAILDFGCGPGRFTSDLSEISHGHVIGVDIVNSFIESAPRDGNVSYLSLDNDTLPFDTETFDAIWCCLTLGGIPNSTIGKTVSELKRILKHNGLIFLVENTTTRNDSYYWHYRSKQFYLEIFESCNLECVHEYIDCDETNSVIAGYKT